MESQYFIDRIEGEKMSISDRLNQIKNNVTVNNKLTESNLTNVENTYIFQDLNFESIFTELEIQDIEFLKQQTLSYFSIGSKTKTMLGKILYDAQIRLADKVGAFLKWSEGVLNIKKSTSYNLINRYQFILNNPNHKDIIEALPLTLSYELSISEDNDLIQEIFNKNIVDVKEIKAFLKKETILEDKVNKNEEPEIIDSPFEEIFEKTFFDIKTKFDNIEESKQKKVKKLLNEIEKIINI